MSTQAKIKSVLLEDDALVCPECGYSNLHHGYICAHQRGHGQAQVVRTLVDGGTAKVEVVANDFDNPSPYRHGLAIGFRCEQCGDVGQLTIAQ